MAEFTGTVVFVSHDRYFIDKLATRVFEIEDGEVRSLPGQLRRLPVAQIRQAARSAGRMPVIGIGRGDQTEPVPDKPAKRVNPMRCRN